ncbi:MAG: response regulator, partial [Planctomycetes bacterium]|nr:response regulator [Planctomycetota bacterium]
MSSDLLRALEGLHDLVLVLDAEGTCRHAGPNPLPSKLFRTNSDGAEGLSLSELFEPDLQDRLQSVARDTARGCSAHFSFELGEAGRFELEAVRSQSGELTVLGVRRAEPSSASSSLELAVLEQIMETGVAGIFVLDPSGTIIYANCAAAEILGLAGSDLVNQRFDSEDWTCYDLDGTETPVSEHPVMQVLESKQPVHDVRKALDTADGERKLISINGAPVLDAKGEVERLVFSVRDITREAQEVDLRERMNREMESLARLDSLSMLAGGVAHDFNNILVGMLGGAELVRELLAPDHPARAALELLEQGALRASELTHQLLAFSGKSRFVVGPRNLSALVRETSCLLEALVSKEANLLLAPADDLPLIDIDSTQVGQVIMNMVLNASQALRPGGGEISVVTRCVDVCAEDLRSAVHVGEDARPGQYVVLEVSDDGAGMPPEVAARVFDPFYSTKPEGHGLGLAAVIGVVRAHHGFVRLQTEPGVGTRFSLGFPVTTSSAPSERAAAVKAKEPFRGTVLIVDDESFVRTVARRILEHAGCRVHTAEDGAAGLATFAQHREEIDAVVLDLSMPRISGADVLAELRRLSPELPVVVTSGFADEAQFAGDPATRFL